ncbi:hypothetical protein ACFX2H_009528 [Malus domestica]
MKPELRLFLRVLHQSSLTSRVGLAFVFASSGSRFGSVIQKENASFLVLCSYRGLNQTTAVKGKPGLGFDTAQFVKAGKKEIEEPYLTDVARDFREIEGDGGTNYRRKKEEGR